MIDRMIEDHRRIAICADGLETQLAPRPPRDLCGIARARWSLTREVLQHVALEDSLLHGSGGGSATDTGTVPGPVAFAALFRDHAQTWTQTDIASNWAEFCTTTRAILATLRGRMRYEEMHIYPGLRDALTEAATNRKSVHPRSATPPPAAPIRDRRCLTGY